MISRSYLLNIGLAALLLLLALTVQSCSMHSSAYQPLTPADEELALKSIERCEASECFETAIEGNGGLGATSQAAYKLAGLRLKFAGSEWGARSSFMLGLLALDPVPRTRIEGAASYRSVTPKSSSPRRSRSRR